MFMVSKYNYSNVFLICVYYMYCLHLLFYTSTIDINYIDISEKPGAPQLLVAFYVTSTLLPECFITALWERPENNERSAVTHYNIVNVNGDIIKTEKIDTHMNTTAFSTSFPATCRPQNHTVSIKAANICSIGPATTYITKDQGDCDINTIIPDHCFAAGEYLIQKQNQSGRNSGNGNIYNYK